MQVLGAQHLAQRAEIGDGDQRRQLVPGHEQIEHLEETDIEDGDQRFRVVLLHDQADHRGAEHQDRHQDAEQVRDDAGLRRQHEGAEEHGEGQHVHGAALGAQPLDVVGDEPRQHDVKTPPRRQEEVGPGMLDQTFREGRRRHLAVEDDVQIAAADALHRPPDMGQERQIGGGPQRAPIGIGAGRARENMEAQRRREQKDRRPDREDHPIIGGGVGHSRRPAAVEPGPQFGAANDQHQQRQQQRADENVSRPPHDRRFHECAYHGRSFLYWPGALDCDPIQLNRIAV